MILAGGAILLGIVIGVARHGRLKNLAGTRVRWVPLLVLGAVVAPLIDALEPRNAAPLLAASLALLVVVAIGNAHLVGASVIAVGLTLNLVPVIVNQAVVVDGDALVGAELVDRADLDAVTLTGPRRLARADDQLVFLGDVIPVPETNQVVSFGDLIILAGLISLTANLMVRRGRVRVPLPHGAEAALLAIAAPLPDRGAMVIDLRTEADRQPVAVGHAADPDDGIEYVDPIPA